MNENSKDSLRVVLAGATGMVGQGALQACLASDDVESVLAITRSPLGIDHPKLENLVHEDFSDLSSIAGRLQGYNACIYAIGVTSFATGEADYTHMTKDLTLVMAEALLQQNRDDMRFCFVSAEGAGSNSKTMWARVKGETEDALLAMPFRRVHVVRPAYIQPGDGIKSRTAMYNLFLAGTRHIYPAIKALFPKHTSTTEELGNAMIRALVEGYPEAIIEGENIRKFGSGYSTPL